MHMKLCSLDWGEWHSLLGWRLHSERMDFPQLLVVCDIVPVTQRVSKIGFKRENRDV